MNNPDADFMHLALQEARKGLGRTSPNPSVGAVIVREGSVVGSGYHHRAGAPHAEVNAIADAGSLCEGATLYVTLEPCNHTGRTPPCTEAVLAAGISRVVVGMADPNPGVAGGGSAFLASRGILVETGLLEEDCIALNRPFIKHSATGMPWVVMKAGMSLDGKISYRPGQGGRITGDLARLYTHRLRNIHDAILVGVDTALIDSPALTCRLPEGEPARDPVRVVVDTTLRLAGTNWMGNRPSTAMTWIFCSMDAPTENERQLVDDGAKVTRIPAKGSGWLDVHTLLALLGREGICSILVEGGARIHGSFLRHQLVDEVYLFMSPTFIGDQGTPLIAGFSCSSPESRPNMRILDVERLGHDILIHGLVNR